MALIYNVHKERCLNPGLNHTTLPILTLLLKGTGYVADADHEFVSDLTPASNEVSGGGYARTAIANPAVSRDNALDRGELDCDNQVFSNIPDQASDPINAAVSFDNTNGTDATRQLIGYHDFGGIQGNGSDITLDWSANIIRLN